MYSASCKMLNGISKANLFPIAMCHCLNLEIISFSKYIEDIRIFVWYLLNSLEISICHRIDLTPDSECKIYGEMVKQNREREKL